MNKREYESKCTELKCGEKGRCINKNKKLVCRCENGEITDSNCLNQPKLRSYQHARHRDSSTIKRNRNRNSTTIKNTNVDKNRRKQSARLLELHQKTSNRNDSNQNNENNKIHKKNTTHTKSVTNTPKKKQFKNKRIQRIKNPQKRYETDAKRFGSNRNAKASK